MDVNIRPNKNNTFKYEIKYYKVNLIGDKWYISQEKFKLRHKKYQ